MSQLPRPLRATIGLVFTCVDTVRSSPEKALEVPMLAVSTALQFSLRAQQRYAEFTVRGDEVLGRLRPTPDEPPAWATFDEDVELDTFVLTVEEDELLIVEVSDEFDAEPTTPSAAEAAATETKAPKKATPAKKSATPRKVSPPRTGRPSAFDTVAETDAPTDAPNETPSTETASTEVPTPPVTASVPPTTVETPVIQTHEEPTAQPQPPAPEEL
ncbi:hypothetical protein SAMN05892883_4345 [Jatrophihabitans sp. GAS493]|uniref:hypothetical protein n=1 Tax=Jatrophihabitans sp. GAS493 TaxID=1907575 RepID=UPI000BB71000|nr:hypothetical protein [Jatrophihabitans sp. GAS493]SOD75140.1 hypothetical protein SAMN05892883_4345 [Jatrophihabitans sp. GAS493]